MKKNEFLSVRIGSVIVLASILAPLSAQSESVTLVASSDTALFEHAPNNNLGGVNFMPIGVTLLGTENRGLVKFDIANSIPEEATITSASLNLRVTRISGFSRQDYSTYRMLSEWGEGVKSSGPNGNGNIGAPATAGEASWNRRIAPSTSWGSPGAQAGLDYVSVPSATVEVSSVANYLFEGASMTSDVRAWHEDPTRNHGWIVIIDNSLINGTARRFASREDAANAPRLTVNFQLPLTIETTALVGDQFQLTFQSQAGQSYIVERRSNVASGDWTTVTNVPVQAVLGTVVVSDQINSESQFYRVGQN